MAHSQQLEFIGIQAKQMPRFFRDAKVLEIGSLDINGSIRQFFDRCDYIGIDIAEGRGVDLVCQGHEYEAPNGSFDHVVSCETMEHNPFWKETFANMIRLCRAGGLVSMTCATTGRGEHGTSNVNPTLSPLTVAIGWEYYRNLKAHDFMKSFDFRELFEYYRFWVNWSSFDLCFAGVRSGPELTNANTIGWTKFFNEVDATIMKHNSSIRSISYRIIACAAGDIGFGMARKIKYFLK